MTMLIKILPALVGTITFVFGSLVLFKEKKQAIQILFSLLCYSVSIWSIGYSFVYLSNNTNSALFFVRLAFIGVVFIPALHLNIAILFINRKQFYIKVFSWIVYIFSFIFLIISRYDVFLKQPCKYWWGYYPLAGKFYIYFVSLFSISFILGAILVFPTKKLKNQISEISFMQYKLMFFAYFITTLAVVDYFPNYNISVYPFGYIVALIWISIMGYSIFRLNLFDINLIIKRTFLYSTIISIMAGLISATFILINIIAKYFFKFPDWVGYIVISFFIATTYEVLKKIVSKLTDNIFFKAEHKLQESLDQLSNELNTLPKDIDSIEFVSLRLIEILRLKKATFFMSNSSSICEYYVKYATEQKNQYSIKNIKDLMLYPILKSTTVLTKQFIDFEAINKQKGYTELLSYFNKHNYIGVIPFVTNHITWGFIFLGEKLSGDNLRIDESKLLSKFAQNMALSIENNIIYLNLEEEKKQLEKIINNISEGVVVLNSQNEILLENLAVNKLFQYNQHLKQFYIKDILLSENNEFNFIMLNPVNSYVICRKYALNRSISNDYIIITFSNESSGFQKNTQTLEFLAFMANSLVDQSNAIKETLLSCKQLENDRHKLNLLYDLVSKMLYFSDLESGPLRIQKRPMRAQDIATDCSQITSLYSKKDIVFQIDYSSLDSEQRIKIDKDRLKQVVNLVIRRFYQNLKNGSPAIPEISIIIKYDIDKCSIKLIGPEVELTQTEINKMADTNHLMESFNDGKLDILELDFSIAYIKHIVDAHNGKFSIIAGSDQSEVNIEIPVE